MATKRNDPCPCGSGRKFKKCCRNSVQREGTKHAAGGKTHFEPATCTLTDGRFVACIAVFGNIDDKSTHSGVIRRDRAFPSEQSAYQAAETDLHRILASMINPEDADQVARAFANAGYEPLAHDVDLAVSE